MKLNSSSSGSVGSNIGTFEDTFCKKMFFAGENKLDRALLSLLHLIDARSSVIEEFEGKTYLTNKSHFEVKIRKHTNKSIRYRYKKECLDDNFSFIRFSFRYGISVDTINGIYPLSFKNSRMLFHSLKISYALYLTMKMFKVDDAKSNQRDRSKLIFLKKENLLSSIFLNIFSQFKKKGLDEKSLIKCIKCSLCTMVSKSLEQDQMPEGLSIQLFPNEVWKQVKEKLSADEIVRFCFSCLQSKVLCQQVPDSFILDTLIKHRDQLSKPHRGLSPQNLALLRERGREFGKNVAKYYRPNEGFFPTGKATFQFPRNMGGVKGDLVYHQRLQETLVKENPDDRMEPFVISLFGQPGQGKSSRINEIVSELSSLFPGVRREQLTYQRTCHVDHWDGYSGQPIVIFDDLGQSMDGHDIQEFQTLVSCCPYVLPMADLSEKGQKFCSPILICTSNLLYGSSLKAVYGTSNPIIDDASFWRRHHFPIYIEDNVAYILKQQPRWVRDENLYFPKSKLGESVRRNTLLPSSFQEERFFQRKADFEERGFQDKWKLCPKFSALRKLFRLRRKYHDNFRQNWMQTVVESVKDSEQILDSLLEDLELHSFTESLDYKSGSGISKSLNFPAYPPVGPLPVRVEPIPEPLKVRIITAGIGDTFCLKPLQRAMWLALGDEPQFSLTHGTNNLESSIERIFEKSVPGDQWASGDYTAATDSFSIEGSKELALGILESIDHEPTKRWLMKEMSPHLLVYPPESGLEPVLQKSGQLMGSLASFPLLCLLNDCTARFAGVSPEKYLINGDDILMRTTPEKYQKWMEKAFEFGLDLSPGKNYLHPRYGTVNSQLIIDGQVVGSGKQNVLDRRSRVLGECLRDLEFAMPDSPCEEVQELFKSVNRAKLSQTVRNISVPVSHGGLSFSWGKPLEDKKSIRTAKLCYLNDFFMRIKPNKGCIAIPYFSKQKRVVSELEVMERTFNEPVSTMEYHEDFLKSDTLAYIQKRAMTHSDLRDLLFDQDLRSMPSLTFLHCYQIPCDDLKVRKELQTAIDHFSLRRFLQGGQDYTYDTFREEFLRSTLNLKDNTKNTVTHLVSLMDLDVSPDFLTYLNLDFDPQAFSKEVFEKQLGKALRPKEFNLPIETEDYVDFSEDVQKDFLNFLTEIEESLEDV